MNSIISFIIVLGLLIFVHEFGHFLFAKLFKVKVLKFSLGFGPKLIGRKYGDTEYLVSAFPLGGYVKMLGENPNEEVPEGEGKNSFSTRPVWQRFIIVAGGPSFNLLFSVVLFFFIFWIAGMPQPVDNTKVGGVTKESPAEAAGLQQDDIIIAINDQPTNTWDDISEFIRKSGGDPVIFKVKRGDEILELTGQPEEQDIKNIFGEVVGQRLMIGIARTDEVRYEKISVISALGAGFQQTWTFIYLTIMAVVKIIQKVVPASEIGGPIYIAQIAGKQLEAGWLNLFYFMGLLSVNLGILNLFPIPILDGGHLFFYTLEGVRRKPLSLRAQEICQQIGLFLLGSLMLFIFYNDLVRLFSGG